MEYSLKREMTCLVFKHWNCRTFLFFSATTQQAVLSENFASTYLLTSPVLDGGTLSASRLLFRPSHGCKSTNCSSRITLIDRLASGSKSWEIHLLTSARRTQGGKEDLPLFCPQASPSSAPGQWVWFLWTKTLGRNHTFHWTFCRDA